ncbi:MAG TPA: 50S ribosomal protein L29 [Terracidiphilus sp.]|nr:50S ribosomal protein L29 [Terracidiphilus sp.]
MEFAKIRNLGDDELRHQEKISAEQLFRLRFQVSLGQNDGVKKLRQLRKEIAQIKTVARERELGIHGESQEAKPAVEAKVVKAEEPAPTAEVKAPKTAKKAAPKTAAAAKTKTAKAKETGK